MEVACTTCPAMFPPNHWCRRLFWDWYPSMQPGGLNDNAHRSRSLVPAPTCPSLTARYPAFLWLHHSLCSTNLRRWWFQSLVARIRQQEARACRVVLVYWCLPCRYWCVLNRFNSVVFFVEVLRRHPPCHVISVGSTAACCMVVDWWCCEYLMRCWIKPQAQSRELLG